VGKMILEALGVLLVVFGVVMTVYTYVFGTLAAADLHVSGQESGIPITIIPSFLILLVPAVLAFVGAFLCFRVEAKN
jgi:hypothetical protein